jgi:Holliday junction resolvasome RuvABC endonuclease subunit
MTMKTTLEMSDWLFRAAKAAAAHRGQSLKELVTGALERELKLSRQKTPRQASAALRSVRAVASANALTWRSAMDSVSAVREQRR